MASDQLKAVVETIRANAGVAAEGLSLADRRAAMEAQVTPIPGDVRVEPVDISGLPACWVTAPGADPAKAVVYFHGGGYVMGSTHTHEELMSRISRVCAARVLGVDYRLAPEHPFPAAVDDGLSAWRWILERGFAPERVMFGGDSAGGGLVLATLLRARDEKTALPAGAMLFSPWSDLTASGASVTSKTGVDPMIPGKSVLVEMAGHYHSDSTNPLVSPLFADLAGLPPLLIQVGDAELLLDDSTRLAERALAAGVDASLRIWDEAPHVFQAIPHLPETAEALTDVGDFFGRHVL